MGTNEHFNCTNGENKNKNTVDYSSHIILYEHTCNVNDVLVVYSYRRNMICVVCNLLHVVC